jgi:RNA polymerase sporulation-specific sigma factor
MKKSDEQLILDYRRGDEDAFDQILERYKNLVKRKASALYIAGGDRDDLIQEGMIGLYKAVRGYDSGRDASFSTYASTCINRQMCTAIAGANRKKHEPLNESVSYDSTVKNDDGEEFPLEYMLSDNNRSNPEYRLIDELFADSLVERILTHLSPYERNVLMLHMEGMGYMEIAKQLQKEPKSVDNALNRIRSKVMKFNDNK